jgi:hypothetical protein
MERDEDILKTQLKRARSLVSRQSLQGYDAVIGLNELVVAHADILQASQRDGASVWRAEVLEATQLASEFLVTINDIVGNSLGHEVSARVNKCEMRTLDIGREVNDPEETTGVSNEFKRRIEY